MIPASVHRAVFISYAREDAAPAHRLVEALRADGIEVWFDQSELRGGDVWDQKIRRQIKECALFLPILSANTQQRGEGYFRLEWNLADQRTLLMGRAKAFIVPVCVDATTESEADAPDSFLAAQWIRLPGGAASGDFVARVHALLDATGSPKPAPAPAGHPLAAPAPVPAPRRTTWRLVALCAAAVALAAVALLVSRSIERERHRTWARAEALPEIRRLIDAENFTAAHALALDVQRRAPEIDGLAALWPRLTQTMSIASEPAGAAVEVRDYADVGGAWQSLGRTPLAKASVVRGMKRWRFTLPGHRTVERAGLPQSKLSVVMPLDAAVPADMVLVPGAPASAYIAGMDPIERKPVADYLIDRHEVSNRQFQAFIAAGGYRKREYWKHPIQKDGAEIPWADAMALFRDPTGRPGPATWEVGGFPPGQEDFPVSGVSWYEAAAYAEYAGRSLPTVYHWVLAASTNIPTAIIGLSNYSGRGPTPAGGQQGMSAYGVYDMAGNAREWLWNSAGGLRHILGGAWNDPNYMFSFASARPPLDRSPGNGFRCVIYGDGHVPAETGGDVQLSHRDYAKEQPVSDDVFRIYLNQFSYDAGGLDPKVETLPETSDWRHELATVSAAYGGERLPLHVYLPKASKPPYQTVVFFPGSGAIVARDSGTAPFPQYLVKSGRAVIFPVYKGTYERGVGLQTTWPNQTHRHAEVLIQQIKDLRRAIDYVAARPELDVQRLAYYGNSWGGRLGGMIPAIEQRIKVGVLLLAGLPAGRPRPEVDQFNYVTRVTVPVLMINGRYDAIEPLEGSQLPMFRLLGTPPEHKKHVVFETGHGPFRQQDLMREVLDWLDKYLGPVQR